MKTFQFEGRTLEGRVIGARLYLDELGFKTVAHLETTEGVFCVVSNGDIADGDWDPELILPSEVGG